ncbi:hypothetical protein JCM15765_14260 [Paradesulfitobacterium aromaticivorans]
MPNNPGLSPHEMLELHEILGSKVTEAKKIQASKAMVNDPDLADFMDKAFEMKKAEIEALQQFIEPATMQ